LRQTKKKDSNTGLEETVKETEKKTKGASEREGGRGEDTEERRRQ
jgi:hypothetical protein